jgi:hypothetical protein
MEDRVICVDRKPLSVISRAAYPVKAGWPICGMGRAVFRLPLFSFIEPLKLAVSLAGRGAESGRPGSCPYGILFVIEPIASRCPFLSAPDWSRTKPWSAQKPVRYRVAPSPMDCSQQLKKPIATLAASWISTLRGAHDSNRSYPGQRLCRPSSGPAPAFRRFGRNDR